MSALCFGIGVQDDTETEAAVFEAAGALAKHHVMSIRHGGAGLGQLNNITNSTTNGGTGGTNSNGNIHSNTTALGGVLHALLERVLINDPGFEAVDYASEAALPLWLAEPAAAEAVLTSITARLNAAGAGGGSLDKEVVIMNVATAFQELGKAAVAASGMDRPSRRQFNSCFRRFVIQVRGVLRSQ